MKLCSLSWPRIFLLIFVFFTINCVYWIFHRNAYYNCEQDGSCDSNNKQPINQDKDTGARPQPPNDIPAGQPHAPQGMPPVPVHPTVPQFVPPPEAKLEDMVQFDHHVKYQPITFKPASHPQSAEDLDQVSPTVGDTTVRLNREQQLAHAKPNDVWQIGIVNTKPDVFIATEGHIVDINNHYAREHRIYTLMKWILRVHRRDADRKQPLVMVDAGSNHGLFSMVAGTSGAHTIAFEPQTHLRSVINLAARLNWISDHVRVLPFAVLDKFKKLSMSNYNVGDGGTGSLDYNAATNTIQTQTIRLDYLPSFDRLFPSAAKSDVPQRNPLQSMITVNDLGSQYAKGLESQYVDSKKQSGDDLKDAPKPMSEALLFDQPIHFLKIDVEGFELPALESASRLYEKGLVENTVLEFGPPSRWDVTIEQREGMTPEQIRATTVKQAKTIMKRVVGEWDLDIYLLPAAGWDRTVAWMLEHQVDYSQDDPTKNKVVHRLKAWDFDGAAPEGDEFEAELNAKNQLVTEYIPLPPNLIDSYLDSLETIGEMYFWLVKRDSKNAIMQKFEL